MSDSASSHRNGVVDAHSTVPIDDQTAMVVGDGTSLGEVYDVLRHGRRRRVLSALATADTPIDVCTLASNVADRETDDETDGGHHKQVQVSLFHHHLPMLADRGLIEYDGDRTVEGVAGHVELISE